MLLGQGMGGRPMSEVVGAEEAETANWNFSFR